MRLVNEKYVEGAAYHEAGHIVVAVVQGLALRKGGLRIDERGEALRATNASSRTVRQTSVLTIAESVQSSRYSQDRLHMAGFTSRWRMATPMHPTILIV